MLDQLPKNMLSPENQEQIKTFFDSTFIKDLPRDIVPEPIAKTEKKKRTTSLINPSPMAVNISKNIMKLNDNEAIFDTFSYGFDFTAGNQLSRLSKKMGRWKIS